MNDRHFLMWVHDRLANVYGENVYADHMHLLRAIAAATPEGQHTVACASEEADPAQTIFKAERQKA